MSKILFERHLFVRKSVGNPERGVSILLHIDFENEALLIGEDYMPYGAMRDYNTGSSIACGPFRGTVDEVAAFIDVYREAFEFGRKRLSDVHNTDPS